jgi:hypothetical protein
MLTLNVGSASPASVPLRRDVGENRRMSERLCVLVMPIDGEKEFYPDAHIAGVRDGRLIVAGGPAQLNGVSPIEDVRREIPLAEIYRVEILEEVTDDDDQTLVSSS